MLTLHQHALVLTELRGCNETSGAAPGEDSGSLQVDCAAELVLLRAVLSDSVQTCVHLASKAYGLKCHDLTHLGLSGRSRDALVSCIIFS